MFWKRKKPKPEEPQAEPLFTAVSRQDEEMQKAYAGALSTLDDFQAHIHRDGEHTCAAKLRFRDPDLSEKLGEDRHLYLWLAAIEHDAATGAYVGTFFEVPKALQAWHQPGQRLQFKGDDIFDWFVNDDGLFHGGFTMRVARSRLPEDQRSAFDSYTGVRQWADADRH